MENGSVGSHEAISTAVDWAEFCENHAQVAAAEFARHFRHFITEHPQYEEPEASNKFARRYVEHFFDHFEVETHKGFNASGDTRGTQLNGRKLGEIEFSNSHFAEETNNQFRHSLHSKEEKSKPPPSSKITVSKKLSFRNMKESVRAKFRRHSEDKDLSKQRPRHDILKEGIVNQLIGEDPHGRNKWERSRLSLVKTDGGHMLEFYSPPKSHKPKNGIFCFLIKEARETTALELPDTENTFVLKTENKMEYVIEATNVPEMRVWLNMIKDCMKKDIEYNEVNHSRQNVSGAPRGRGDVNERLPPIPSASRTLQDAYPSGLTPIAAAIDKPTAHVTPNSIIANNITPPGTPPQLPPRKPADSMRSRLSSGASDIQPSYAGRSDSPAVASLDTDSVDWHAMTGYHGSSDMEDEHPLSGYPWFHGTLSRIDAAQLVLQGGPMNHGVFLVRQSETRRGEYVLTFNFQGRAKHLRMSLNNEGQCRVQHLWFQTIFDMLEHFRSHPIPLESGGSSDVTLTNFVVNIPRAPERTIASAPATPNAISDSQQSIPQLQQSLSVPSHSSLPLSDVAAPPSGGNNGSLSVSNSTESELNQVLTFSGSVRVRTNSAGSDSSPHSNQGRAIENMYSFM
ncbi:SH2B adapter protein 2-like [Glandiceps talaboti]